MARVELNLVSSSSSSGLPATDLDMTFGIPKEVLALHEWASWHQGITPFRDRLGNFRPFGSELQLNAWWPSMHF